MGKVEGICGPVKNSTQRRLRGRTHYCYGLLRVGKHQYMGQTSSLALWVDTVSQWLPSGCAEKSKFSFLTCCFFASMTLGSSGFPSTFLAPCFSLLGYFFHPSRPLDVRVSPGLSPWIFPLCTPTP